MKKFLFVLIILFTCVNFVEAESLNVVGDDLWQEEKIEDDNVEVQYRYRFYKDKKMGKYIRMDLDSDYEFTDSNDIRRGIYSSYQTDCVPKYYQEIDYATKYYYKEILPVKYIKIINTSNEDLKIDSVFIYNLNNKLNNKIVGYKNANIDNMVIKNGGYIVYWMAMDVSLKQFGVEVNVINDNVNYDLVFSNDETFSDDKIVAKVNGSSFRNTYRYDNSFNLSNNYSDVYFTFNPISYDFVKLVDVVDVCRLRDIYTYRYNIEKEYYDDNYYASIDDILGLSYKDKSLYKKDLEDYKIFYRYVGNDLFDITDTNYVDDTNINDNFLENDIKLVKTGAQKDINYKFLILYVLLLMLIALLLIKKIKNNVD